MAFMPGKLVHTNEVLPPPTRRALLCPGGGLVWSSCGRQGRGACDGWCRRAAALPLAAGDGAAGRQLLRRAQREAGLPHPHAACRACVLPAPRGACLPRLLSLACLGLGMSRCGATDLDGLIKEQEDAVEACPLPSPHRAAAAACACPSRVPRLAARPRFVFVPQCVIASVAFTAVNVRTLCAVNVHVWARSFR